MLANVIVQSCVCGVQIREIIVVFRLGKLLSMHERLARMRPPLLPPFPPIPQARAKAIPGCTAQGGLRRVRGCWCSQKRRPHVSCHMSIHTESCIHGLMELVCTSFVVAVSVILCALWLTHELLCTWLAQELFLHSLAGSRRSNFCTTGVPKSVCQSSCLCE